MIIIENKCVTVLRIDFSAHPMIARAQVTIGLVFRQLLFLVLNHRAVPRSILPMCRNDDPFLTQRVPSFFPRH
jgi:hypothetical protein